MYATEKGLPYEDVRNWLVEDPVTGVRTVNQELIRDIIMWLGRKALEQGKDAPSPNLFQNSLKAIQDDLKKQANSGTGELKIPAGYIRELAQIPELIKKVKAVGKAAPTKNLVDMQAHLDVDLPPKRLIGGLRDLLSFATFPALAAMTVLNRIQQVAILLSATYCLFRGEDQRHLNLACLFTVDLHGVGPNRFITALGAISSEGKCNTSGNFNKTGMAPHVNPLLCAITAIATVFVYRFQVLHEPTPTFLEIRTLYECTLYRSAHDPSASISYGTMHEACEQLYAHMGLDPPGSTHYWRKLGHIMQNNAGVSDEDIDRHCNRSQEGRSMCTNDSYFVNFMRACLIVAAGGDREHPSSFHAAHFEGIVPDELVFLVFPWLREELESVRVALAGASGTRHKKKKDRLFTAEGSLNAMFFIVRTLLRSCAARPRDDDNCIEEASPPLFQWLRKM